VRPLPRLPNAPGKKLEEQQGSNLAVDGSAKGRSLSHSNSYAWEQPPSLQRVGATLCGSAASCHILGLARTVHWISMTCIYAVFPYIPYMRENGFTLK
jgi:hypothetical protein